MSLLRPYQIEAVDAIFREWETVDATLLVAAVGSGKTQIFSEVLDRKLRAGGRGLVLAHRKELVEQARDRLLQFWPQWIGKVGVVMADLDECGRAITYATVQTLSSDARLARALAAGAFTIVVTDEAHHSAADSYQALYAKLREVNPALKHLGVTATPLRADQVGLKAVYQSTAAKYDIRDMIRAAYLVPPRWLAIQTGISLATVATRYDDGEKDYSARQLANVFETENCYDLVVETHKQYAAERKCIAFTVTVEGAYKLAEKFNAAGVRAQAADGTTGKRERAQILGDFRNGQTQVLCNVGLYTEGLDVPETSCIHQVRPTQSDGLYIQMIGRALRLFAGKTDALVLDYAPKEARQIVMLGDVLGAPVRKEVLVADRPERGDVLGGFTFDGAFAYLQGNPAEIISRQLDYLSLSPFVWNAPDRDGWMTLGLGQGGDERERILAISPAAEQQTLYGLVKAKGAYGYGVYVLATGDFETLQLRAEELAEKWGDATLAQKERTWRRQPVSDPQRNFLKKLGARQEIISRGEAAKVITHLLALQTLRREGLHASR